MLATRFATVVPRRDALAEWKLLVMSDPARRIL